MFTLRSKLFSAMTAAAMVLAVGCNSPHAHHDTGYPDAPATRELPDTENNAQANTSAADGMVQSSVAYPTGDRATSALLLERMAPAQVNVGEAFTYTYKVTNISGGSLEDVTLIHSNVSGFTVDSANPPGTVRDASTVWSIGDMEAGESETITVKGSAQAVGTLANCATAEYAKRACLTVNVVQPALKLVKTMTPQVVQCDPIQAKYVITNNGSGVAKNVVISDELPEGLTTAKGSKTVQATVGTLAAGESKTYTIELKAAKTGSFVNNATATGDGGLEAKDSATTEVVKPVLAIEKTGPEKVFIGRNVSYTIKLSNTGDGEARDTMLVDTLPAGVELVSSDPPATVAGNRLTWSLGTMAAGASQTATVVVKPTAKGELVNTTSATAFCADPVKDEVKTVIAGIPAVLLEVVDVTDPVEIGQTTTYVIQVTNQGSAIDTNVTIVAQLEDTMSFVRGTGSTEVDNGGQTVTFKPLAKLEPGDVATWRVIVKAEKPGDVRFKITMTTDQLTRPVEETEATTFYE